MAYFCLSCKNCQQLPSAGISSAVFLRMRPRHHQQTEKQKNCQSEQDVDQIFYSAMEGRQSHNKDNSDTVKPPPSNICLCTIQINIEKRARCGSLLRLCLKYPSKTKFPPSCTPDGKSTFFLRKELQ